MASSNHSFTGSKNTAATSRVSALSVPLGDSSTQARQANALAREHAAFTAARSSERQDIAARNLAIKTAEQAHSWQRPMSIWVRTSGFGWRWGRLHAGEDFAAPVGTTLVAMSSGMVIFASQESGYGNMVKIRYWDGTVTFYAHMSSLSVTEGESVTPGQVVGQSGNTGHSTGPHLHLEVHPDGGAAINPVPWLSEHHLSA
jgi:murein DD-endopeptidase MepM/ murein hydrolase activator NlpD